MKLADNRAYLLQKKIIFNNQIFLTATDYIDSYQKDLSPMFSWMKNIGFSNDTEIFDIGANIGVFSLAYASMFQHAEIHAFEPINFIHKQFLKNLQLNPKLSSRIHAHNVGISNCFEQKSLSIPTQAQHERYESTNDIRLFSVFGKGKERFNADFVPLDQWITDHGVANVNFIKIDVEGYEYPVLQGAEETLRSFKPVVMFELNTLTLTLSDVSVNDYLSFAKSLNYKVYGLQYGYKTELLKIDDVKQVELISDIVLLP